MNNLTLYKWHQATCLRGGDDLEVEMSEVHSRATLRIHAVLLLPGHLTANKKTMTSAYKVNFLSISVSQNFPII